MKRTEDDQVARRRDELARDRGSRRFSSVIDVQRRLTARAVRDARTEADPVGPSDPRYAYLARTYDEQGSVRLTCDENGIDLGHTATTTPRVVARRPITVVDVFPVGSHARCE